MTNADRIRSMTDEELVSIIDCPYNIYPIIESKVLKAMRRELGRYTAEVEEDNG